jgi:hypothetical protein
MITSRSPVSDVLWRPKFLGVCTHRRHCPISALNISHFLGFRSHFRRPLTYAVSWPGTGLFKKQTENHTVKLDDPFTIVNPRIPMSLLMPFAVLLPFGPCPMRRTDLMR